MNPGINESKTLRKHISCEFKYRIDGKKCNFNESWNNDKCRCECKKNKLYVKLIMFGILLCVIVGMENI